MPSVTGPGSPPVAPWRILVTGCAGFIGSHLVEALLDAGHEVIGLDAFVPYYPRAVKEANLTVALANPRFRFHELDLRSDDLAPALDGVDAVVNEAAMAGLPLSWTDLPLYAGCNLLGLGRLLDACREARVGRFLQVSTSSVYGSHAVGDESMPLRPASPYGVTKLAAEHLVLAYRENFGLDASIVRYFSIYGPRQRPDMGYHRFIEAILDGRPIQVFGDGEQSRSSTYVSDCVRGTILALDGGTPGEVFNIGGGDVITVNEVIATLEQVLGRRAVVEHVPPRAGDQRHTAADTTRARERFGYVPTVAPGDGLRRQARWHLERRAADASDAAVA
jgi:UDP-glucuronate 4-epimerase